MITIIVCDDDDDEQRALIKCVKEELAIRFDEHARFLRCSNVDELLCIVEETDIGDIFILDFNEFNGEKAAKIVRKKFPDILLMICVKDLLSPRAYIKPGILASSVLFKPFSTAELRETVDELLYSYKTSFLDCDNKNSYRVETKEGVVLIPYNQINYFEASAKRIYVRTNNEEIGYYDTIEHVEKLLPSSFVRCHRSYIVNLLRVFRFDTANNYLLLEGGITVPVSRGYRGKIQGCI